MKLFFGKINLNNTDYIGNTCLMNELANKKQINLKFIKLALQNGCNPFIRNNAGLNCFNYIIRFYDGSNEKLKIIELFINYANGLTNNIFKYIYKFDYKLVNLFLEKGIFNDLFDNTGNNILMSLLHSTNDLKLVQ